MKRSGFKPKAPPPRPSRQWEGEAPKVAPARATLRSDGRARMVVPVPKFAYVRDERLRDMCRAMCCQHCGKGGPDAGVTWAHSNQAIHGKGLSEKASDVYVAAMCTACHAELDHGKNWPQDVKVRVWEAAHRRTKLHALANGLWPKDIPCPGYDLNKERETCQP